MKPMKTTDMQEQSPTKREIEELFEQINREASRRCPAEPVVGNEKMPDRVDFVLDNTSKGAGTVLAIYGQLE